MHFDKGIPATKDDIKKTAAPSIKYIGKVKNILVLKKPLKTGKKNLQLSYNKESLRKSIICNTGHEQQKKKHHKLKKKKIFQKLCANVEQIKENINKNSHVSCGNSNTNFK